MRHIKHLSIDNKSELSNRPHPSLVYAYKPMTIIERTKSSLIQSEAFQAMHNRLQSCLTRMEALFMRHVFKAQKLGYGDDKTEGVWFDADDYTKEEAEAEFRPYQGVTQKATTTQDTSMTGRGIITTLTLGSSRTTICQQAMPICGEGRNTLTALRTADF